jgi:hypothetical protein
MWKKKAVFYAEGGQYNTKSIGVGTFPPDIDGNPQNLLFNTFIWSHFPVFKNSEIYNKTIDYFKNFSDGDGFINSPGNL